MSDVIEPEQNLITPVVLQRKDSKLKPDGLPINCQFIQDDHIVTRTKNGAPYSRFKDRTWNFSAYTINQYKSVNFKEDQLPEDHPSYIAPKILLEMKELLCFLWYGAGLALSTWTGSTCFARKIARFATREGISIKHALQSDWVVRQLIGDLNSFSRSILLKNFISFIKSCDNTQIIFGDQYPYSVSNRLSQSVSDLYQQFKGDHITGRTQTLVIPERIYASFISQAIEAVEQFLELADDIEIYLEKRSQFMRLKAIEDGFTLLNCTPSETTRANRFGTEKSYAYRSKALNQFPYVDDLTNYCSNIQAICYHLIMAFTGMRKLEARSIPYNGFRSISYGKKTVYGFDAYTSKLDEGVYEEEFWTSGEITEKVNKAAQIICRIIMVGQRHQDFPHDERKVPLFLSSMKRTNPNPIFDFPTKVIKLLNLSALPSPDELIVTQEDKAESDWIDPYKVNDIVTTGEYWPFRCHQFRRSMVVYATRANVRIPVLQAQTKHKTTEQVAYYGRSSLYAANLKEALQARGAHSGLAIFAGELERESIELQTSLIEEEIIEQPARLYGGTGSAIQKDKDLNQLQARFANTEQTREAVSRGELSIRRGPAGWCMTNGPCDKLAFSIPIPCVGCSDAVFVDNEETTEILQDQIEIFELRIKKNGSGPFSESDQRQINTIKRLLQSRDKLIPLEDKS